MVLCGQIRAAKRATFLWPVSFYDFDLIPIRPPCPDGFERVGMAWRFLSRCSIRDPVWIEPKNLKKDIALKRMFGKLHPRFQTEGGEI
jgi:hypothetical protein